MTENERKQRRKYIVIVVLSLFLAVAVFAGLVGLGVLMAYKEDLDRTWSEVEWHATSGTESECLAALDRYAATHDSPLRSPLEIFFDVPAPDPAVCAAAPYDDPYDYY